MQKQEKGTYQTSYEGKVIGLGEEAIFVKNKHYLTLLSQIAEANPNKTGFLMLSWKHFMKQNCKIWHDGGGDVQDMDKT